jgi:dienelactone hydrolase
VLAWLLTTGAAAGGGCRDAGTPPAKPTAAGAPYAIAGVRYEPGAPLDAAATPLNGEGVRSFSVRFRGANGETVPGLLSLPPGAEGAKPAPCVLLLHGLGGSKGQMLLPALALARRGYATLAIDIAGHGERARIGGKEPSAYTLAEMRQGAAQTVVDLRRAVDFLTTRPEIDKKRLGFVGVSLGGILGGVFVADEPRVRAACLWAAGGDWGKLVITSAHPTVQKLRAAGTITADAAAIEAQMAEVDPARTAGRIAPRPLLMINGDRDTIVPRACTDALFAAAREPKRIDFLPGGHVPDPMGMMERTVAWLDKNL